MNILAIDTATEILSLYAETDSKSIELTRDIDLRHSEQIVPLVDWVLTQVSLRPADLELIVVSGGPGSFTGLRIGMAFAKGFAAGVNCPYVTVPTLDAYASRFTDCSEQYIAPMIDAKKQKFYTALWKGNKRITEYLDVSPQEFQTLIPPGATCLLTGPHASLFHRNAQSNIFILDPFHREGSGRRLARLGMGKYRVEGPASANAGPFYLRKSDAEMAKREL